MHAVAERVKQTREARDWAQINLDDAAQLGRGTVNRFEMGLRPEISFATVARIARVLGVSLDWLAWGKGDEASDLDVVRTNGLDVTALSLQNQLNRLKLIDWLETKGHRLPLHVLTRGLKVFREQPPATDASGVPVGGWAAFFEGVGGGKTGDKVSPRSKRRSTRPSA